MKLDSVKLSKILLNSILNDNWNVKTNRLSWEKYSIIEAKTGLTDKWTKSKRRIIIWLNDNWELILIDGTHLLEAHRILGKKIPEFLLDFTSIEAKNMLLDKFK